MMTPSEKGMFGKYFGGFGAGTEKSTVAVDKTVTGEGT